MEWHRPLEVGAFNHPPLLAVCLPPVSVRCNHFVFDVLHRLRGSR